MKDIKRLLRSELKSDYNKELDSKIPKAILKNNQIFYISLVVLIGAFFGLLSFFQTTYRSDLTEFKKYMQTEVKELKQAVQKTN